MEKGNAVSGPLDEGKTGCGNLGNRRAFLIGWFPARQNEPEREIPPVADGQLQLRTPVAKGERIDQLLKRLKQ